MRSAALVFGFLLAGCSVDALDVGSVAVTIQTTDLLVSPGNRGQFTVIARNPTDARVEWGQGSSGCQLGFFVLSQDGLQRLPSVERACTADLVVQGLGPGESRTEVFEWGGQVIIDGAAEQLETGLYRLVGVAGDKGESEPLEVQVAQLPD